ncbi:MAG TPA: fibronectin type III domain-containing protein, partial [Gammaproteobacteria bacterium]|nr:fibronectin type III domain-containing protein [Gammaproteobacteria bacterium]
ANTVRVDVTDGGAGGNASLIFNFGICSRVQVMNFLQNGDAADGLVNPWHAQFIATGRIVYFMSGEALITNTVESIKAGETGPASGAGAPDLNMAGAATLNDTDPTADVSYTVPASYLFTNFGDPGALGPHSWRVNVHMVTGGTTVTSANSLSLLCNKIQISGITFANGGGRDVGAGVPPSAYFIRSINQSGTRIIITAQPQFPGGPGNMVGDTTFRVSDGTNTFLVTIPGGSNTGSALVTIPSNVTVPLGRTTGGAPFPPVTYQVAAIFGGAFDGDGAALGQISPARIVGVINNILWENADPPGPNAPYSAVTPFTTLIGSPLSTASSITVSWNALSYNGAVNGGNWDADFDTYRIYYRQIGSSSWTMVDKIIVPALGTITTGTATITGLLPLTQYEFRLSAIDAFGNEVSCGPCGPSPAFGNQVYGMVITAALTVEATVSDGIALHNNAAFNNADPAAHLVRQTAIKVTLFIVTAGGQPDQVNIIIANNDSDLGPGPPQYGLTGTNDDILSLPDSGPTIARWTIPCNRTASNTYEGFISSEHPLMKFNTNIRFIVEMFKGGTPNWVDHTPDPAPPGDHQSDEWRFRVGQLAVFIPWPTRVLNNVMTSMMPCCFPAYFLAVDSLVTIKVYDVKGRVIATLSDRIYRPGGQNIKDLGWCGRNKENKRVGPGLYYIHINAVTFGNKTVLDKILKVVVSH